MHALIKDVKVAKKKSSYAGMLIKEKPTQMEKIAHHQRRPKLQRQPKNEPKIQQSRTPKAAKYSIFTNSGCVGFHLSYCFPAK